MILKRHQKSHPEFDASINDWEKFRFVLEGGRKFVNHYLKQFSARESQKAFTERKDMTYCPAHAEASLYDIRNAIYVRMQDIVRDVDIESFQQCARGELGGVDNAGSTMDYFIGQVVLTELLFLGKVGIVVDRSPLYATANTKELRLRYHPYMYILKAEEIVSWHYDENEELDRLLVYVSKDEVDETYGLIVGVQHEYRLYTLVDGVVTLRTFNTSLEETGESVTLALTKIPVTIVRTSRPLLMNVADYQVALLNMESSDVNYAVKSNFTFYTEQYDPRTDAVTKGASIGDDGEITASDDDKGGREFMAGHSVGRRYPLGADRPDFIAPPSGPLQASMAKQDAMKHDIRKLINLNMSLLEPTRASAESKKMDFRGLESGLSSIGMDLEFAERDTITNWVMFEGKSGMRVSIKYPTSFDPKSDDERVSEAENYLKLAEKSLSETYRKEMTKLSAKALMHGKVNSDVLKKIMDEIDSNPAVISVVKDIIEAHREGLVGDDLASRLLGYPDGEAAKATVDHANRAARIAVAQAKAAQTARGVEELDENHNSDKDQKERLNDTEFKSGDGKRGEA